MKNYNIDFNKLGNVSEDCLDLIQQLLNPKKEYRITASEALKHPFFTNKLNPKNIVTQNKDLSILKRFEKIKKWERGNKIKSGGFLKNRERNELREWQYCCQYRCF